MMRSLFFTFVFVLLVILAKAQELNCQVSVTHRQVQGSNTRIFETLQKDITEFMNNRKWTDHVFSNNERIECTILINVSDFNGTDRFTASIQVTVRRPVFNTSFNTTTFNYKEQDKEFQFLYMDQQPMEFNENAHLSNLTSVLAFYAYVILGVDYDSFSGNGGTVYFQKAQKIMNNAQTSGDAGWKAFESRNQNNRYYMLETFTENMFAPLREASYKYHRLGLDLLSQKPDAARKEIIEALKLVQKAYRAKPSAFPVQLFLLSKSDEIINIFSEAQPTEAQEVINIMKEIDISNASKYDAILKKN